MTLPSGTFGKPIPHLKSVCWLDGSITLSGIVSGLRYRLYLLHGFDESSQMVDSATLKVKTIRENLEDAKESVVFEDTYVK